jgi:hypothetical protein
MISPIVAVCLVSIALVSIVVGYYDGRLQALRTNPVVKVHMVPRTLYEEQLGVAWTSRGGAAPTV